MPATLEKPRAHHMSVKLEDSERDRLKSLAVAKKRTPHYLMKEAIQAYLEKEELEQRFIAAAKESLAHYKETGLHVSHDEFSQWVDDLQSSPKATPPACHV